MLNCKLKSEETLRKQIFDVSQELGVELLPPLEPETPDRDRLLKLKEAYPERYKLYFKLLCARRSNNIKMLSDDEKEAYQIWTKAVNNLANYLAGKIKYSGAGLRLIQEKMTVEIYRYLESGGREGYIVLPTQVGKTAIAGKLTAILDLATLSVTERRFDVIQMKSEYERFGVQHAIGIVGGGCKELDEQTTITTYASMRNMVHKGEIDPDDFPLLILNEAHHALGEKTRQAVDKFKKSIVLGLTATADFSVDKGLWWILPHKIYQMEVNEAVREGLLKNVRVYVAEVETDLSSVKLRSQGDFDPGELERVINVAANNKAAARLYAKMFPGKLALVFCAGVEHARAVANEFNMSGIPAASVDGNTPEGAYTQIMKKFDAGEINVICCADLLIESFSQPKASVCLNLRPTLSMRLAEQRGGRILALDEANPDAEAVIVDFLYRSKKQLVTYYDVLGDAHVTHAVNPPKPSKEKKKDKNQKGLLIDGIRLHTETEQVVLFLKEYAKKTPSIKLRKVLEEVAETKVDTKDWDEMIKITGRAIEENCWLGRVNDIELMKDPNNIFVDTKVTSLPVRKIIHNPEWAIISSKHMLKQLNPVQQYEGKLTFLITGREFGKEDEETDAKVIRRMITRGPIRPVPIKKACAILAWILTSKHAKAYRSDHGNYAYFYIPTIKENGVVGCISICAHPYDKNEYRPDYDHDIIWLEYQNNIKAKWDEADNETIGLKIISDL